MSEFTIFPFSLYYINKQISSKIKRKKFLYSKSTKLLNKEMYSRAET